jgi:8-oxo-dGTP pyrophosphatase MutT (NUDIX family)
MHGRLNVAQRDEVTINDRVVGVSTGLPKSECNLEAIMESLAWKRWLATIAPELGTISWIEITGAHFHEREAGKVFGMADLKLGHVGWRRTVEPRLFMLRGDSVVVLPIIRAGNDQERRVVLVEQSRVSAGRNMLQLVMGSIEDGQTPQVAAQHELATETRISRPREDFFFMGGPTYPNMGTSSQRNLYYGIELQLASGFLQSLEDSIVIDHESRSERLKVRTVPLNQLFEIAAHDQATLAAMLYYMQYAKPEALSMAFSG